MPGSKQVGIAWNPSLAPAGVVGYYAPRVLGAPTVRGLNGGAAFSNTGAVTVTGGPYGPQVGSFATTRYLESSGTLPLPTSSFPVWMASLWLLPSAAATTSQCVLGAFSSASANPICALFANGAVAGTPQYRFRSDAGTNVQIGGITGLNDGRWHVSMGVSYAANSHALFVDGVSSATSSTSLGAATFTHWNVGAGRQTSVTFAATQASIAAWAIGFGAVPNPMMLYQDWISGMFSPIQPIDFNGLYAVPPAAGVVVSSGYRKPKWYPGLARRMR